MEKITAEEIMKANALKKFNVSEEELEWDDFAKSKQFAYILEAMKEYASIKVQDEIERIQENLYCLPTCKELQDPDYLECRINEGLNDLGIKDDEVDVKYVAIIAKIVSNLANLKPIPSSNHSTQEV